MDVEIKRAGLPQIDELIKWRKIVLSEVFSPDGISQELMQQNINYYLNKLKTEGNISCFAYYRDQIIGCGAMCLYEEMPSPDNLSGKCAYLMNIYISPEYRRRGAAAKVVKWLVGEATSRGISKIYLETTDLARPLYRELGFEEMDGYMMYTFQK